MGGCTSMPGAAELGLGVALLCASAGVDSRITVVSLVVRWVRWAPLRPVAWQQVAAATTADALERALPRRPAQGGPWGRSGRRARVGGPRPPLAGGRRVGAASPQRKPSWRPPRARRTARSAAGAWLALEGGPTCVATPVFSTRACGRLTGRRRPPQEDGRPRGSASHRGEVSAFGEGLRWLTSPSIRALRSGPSAARRRILATAGAAIPPPRLAMGPAQIVLALDGTCSSFDECLTNS